MKVFAIEKSLDSNIVALLAILYEITLLVTFILFIGAIVLQAYLPGIIYILIGTLIILTPIYISGKIKEKIKRTLIERIIFLLNSNENIYPLGETKITKIIKENNLIKINSPLLELLECEDIKKIEELSGHKFIAKEDNDLIFKKEKDIIKAKKSIPIPYADIIEKEANEILNSLPPLLNELYKIFGEEIEKGHCRKLEYKNNQIVIKEGNLFLCKIIADTKFFHQKIKCYKFLTKENKILYKTAEIINKKYLSNLLERKGFKIINTYPDEMIVTIPISKIKKTVQREKKRYINYPEVETLEKNIEKAKQRKLTTEIQHEIEQIEKNYTPKIVSLYEKEKITQKEFKDLIETMNKFVEKLPEDENELETLKIKAFKTYIEKKYKNKS
ncbi:hypothetical protein [Persephonella sp. KM09-Lau-8]|uniref:hypothetical protein n=1 Tax=Persephonella sp. KM09-Lau-8 TaxID=1158345 RepID=UPI0004982A3F|nr:hypothetical protein [Persephonella sp. KM09-Lau-8]